jgi:hypothetical protein
MPFEKYSPKQKKLARVAKPRNKITKADFDELGNGVSLAKGGKIVYKKKGSSVNKAGNYTKPEMRKRLVAKYKAGTKGGKAGQWSARKAQMVAKEYKAKGGGYTS